jgi:hypothetical protein
MRARRRPCLEVLEDRWCPAVTALLSGGMLGISGDSANLHITRSATGAFTIMDNGNPVSSRSFALVRDLSVNLGGGNDRVVIDLGGGTLPGGVTVDLGSGTDALIIRNGTIAKDLSVFASSSADTVKLTGLSIGGDTTIGLGGGPADSLWITGRSSLHGSIEAINANHFTLDAGSTVHDSVHLLGGTAANTVNINGTVGKDVIFVSNLGVSYQANTLNIRGRVGHDVLFTSSLVNHTGHTVNVTGTVGHNLVFVGSGKADTLNLAATASVGNDLRAPLGDGADTVFIAGHVGHRLMLDSGAGNDTVTVAGTATIGASAFIVMGGGNDRLSFGGSLGTNKTTGDLFVDTGPGDDQVILPSTAVVHGNATVLLGAGKDSFTFAGKVIGKLKSNGGSDNDTFHRSGGSFGSISLGGFEHT